jgi:hypothetical protein
MRRPVTADTSGNPAIANWTALGMIEKLARPVAARLQELEEMAARLLALARKLPPGQRRYYIMQEIGRFRVQIAALKGPELGRSHRRAEGEREMTSLLAVILTSSAVR